MKMEAEEGLGGAIRPAERMRPGRQVGGWRIGRAEEGDAARTAGGGRKPESGGRRREALQAGRKREKQGRQRKEQLPGLQGGGSLRGGPTSRVEQEREARPAWRSTRMVELPCRRGGAES